MVEKKRTLPRRTFLKKAGAVAVGVGFGIPQIASSKVLGVGGKVGANGASTRGTLESVEEAAASWGTLFGG